jgi:hypothetical protein
VELKTEKKAVKIRHLKKPKLAWKIKTVAKIKCNKPRGWVIQKSAERGHRSLFKTWCLR